MAEDDYNKILIVIGTNISIERTGQGMSKSDLAKKTGYNRNDLLLLEDGKKDIKLGTLLKISEALNVNPAKLCLRTYEMDKKTYKKDNAFHYADDDYLLVFTENVKRRLKAKGRKKYSICANSGIDQTTLSRILNQKILNPRLSVLVAIADGVESDLASLLTRNQEADE